LFLKLDWVEILLMYNIFKEVESLNKRIVFWFHTVEFLSSMFIVIIFTGLLDFFFNKFIIDIWLLEETLHLFSLTLNWVTFIIRVSWLSSLIFSKFSNCLLLSKCCLLLLNKLSLLFGINLKLVFLKECFCSKNIFLSSLDHSICQLNFFLRLRLIKSNLCFTLILSCFSFFH